MKSEKIHLALFLTGGNSLRTWDNVGTFKRELAVYKQLKSEMNMALVSYGGPREHIYRLKLGGIKLICNTLRRSYQNYIDYLIDNAQDLFKGVSVIKSNQIRGADVAFKVAQKLKVKFIARCGYLPSNNARVYFGDKSTEYKDSVSLEDKVFNNADQIIVTAPQMRQTVHERYHVAEDKIAVIPNYVDVKSFLPQPSLREKKRLCFVGHLDKQKNVENLLAAIKGLNVHLDLIGEGSLKNTLKEKAKADNLSVSFLGKISNEKVSDCLNKASVFVLPSLVEGHPKALLEAMSCGLAVIGSDISGIREIITHKENGYLCQTDKQSIHTAIKDLMNDQDLCKKMGEQAREYIMKEFSLEKIVVAEQSLINRVVGHESRK